VPTGVFSVRSFAKNWVNAIILKKLTMGVVLVFIEPSHPRTAFIVSGNDKRVFGVV
jgi:hypothetical protein